MLSAFSDIVSLLIFWTLSNVKGEEIDRSHLEYLAHQGLFFDELDLLLGSLCGVIF